MNKNKEKDSINNDNNDDGVSNLLNQIEKDLELVQVGEEETDEEIDARETKTTSRPDILLSTNGDIPSHLWVTEEDFMDPVMVETYTWAEDKQPTIIKIFNMVFTCKISIRPNARMLVERLAPKYSVQYNKKEFAACIIRYSNLEFNLKIAILIFEQGKIVCTGAKVRTQMLFVLGEILSDLKKIYEGVRILSLQVQNVVACVKMPWFIDQQALALGFSDICIYEPTLFPGLVMRPLNISATGLIFESGHIVITGLKKKIDLKNFMETVPLILKKYSYMDDEVITRLNNKKREKYAEEWGANSVGEITKIITPKKQRRSRFKDGAAVTKTKRTKKGLLPSKQKSANDMKMQEQSIERERKVKEEEEEIVDMPIFS